MHPSSIAWRARAVCSGLPIDIFFPLEVPGPRSHDPYKRARGVCASCSVRRECFREALESNELEGFRAGLTPVELKRVASARREAVREAFSC